MAAFPWATRRVLPVRSVIVFGVVFAAVLVGFSLPGAMAAQKGGGHAGGGYHGGSHHGGGHAARKPAPNYYPPKNYAPKRPAPIKPTHKKYVPPKPVVQDRVVQKHEPQKHTPSKHPAQRSAVRKPPAQHHVSEKNLAKRSTFSRVVPPSKFKRPTPALQTARKLPKHSFSQTTHPVYRYHFRWRHPGWRHFHWHHHHWHHPWWLYDDYDYYDDYWYATNPYFDYADLRRQMAINRIWAQIVVAEEVFQSAVSRQGLSQTELEAAKQQMVEARAAIQSAVAQQVESNKTMREIEARLVAEQAEGSEFKQAQAKVDATRAAIDREVHRVLSLPPHAGTPTSEDYAHEIAMFSPDQKERLDKDPRFLGATAKLKAAAQELARVRQALFEKDPDWVAARDETLKARQSQTEADRKLGKVTGVGQLNRKLQLYGAQNLAAQARAVIAAGRAALRSLGASVPVAMDEPNASSSP